MQHLVGPEEVTVTHHGVFQCQTTSIKWEWDLGKHLWIKKNLSIAPNPEAKIRCADTTKLVYKTNTSSTSGFKKLLLAYIQVIAL